MIGTPDIGNYCIDPNAYYVSTSVFNVALDFWILVLPFHIVWSLRLSNRRKVGVTVIFLLGGLYVSRKPFFAAVRVLTSTTQTSTWAASIARTYTVANIGLADFPCEYEECH